MCVKQLYKYIKTKIRMLKEWVQRDYKPHYKYNCQCRNVNYILMTTIMKMSLSEE